MKSVQYEILLCYQNKNDSTYDDDAAAAFFLTFRLRIIIIETEKKIRIKIIHRNAISKQNSFKKIQTN